MMTYSTYVYYATNSQITSFKTRMNTSSITTSYSLIHMYSHLYYYVPIRLHLAVAVMLSVAKLLIHIFSLFDCPDYLPCDTQKSTYTYVLVHTTNELFKYT